MNTYGVFFLVITVAGFAGCQHPASARGGRTRPQVRTSQVMIPLDQIHYFRPACGTSNHREEHPAAALTTRSVQTDSVVSAIQLNRYPDPARPDELMHEAHVVYRREALPRWRLRAPSVDEQILVGPQLTDGRGEIRPLASQELDAYLRQQRENQQRQQQLMSTMADGVRQLAQQHQALAEEVSRLKSHAEQARAASPSAGAAEKAVAPAPSETSETIER